MTGDGKKYGVDVAKERSDDLDQLAFEYVHQHPGCMVLDVGCGAGGQSLRLATAGAFVLGVDIDNYESAFAHTREQYDIPTEQLQFLHADLRELGTNIANHEFDLAVVQRVVHYVQYREVVQFLRHLKQLVSGPLYISASGLDSAMGEGYVAKNKPVQSRWGRLDGAVADQFSIHAPVCLYTKTELITLLNEAGWETTACWVSDFGNVKAVAE